MGSTNVTQCIHCQCIIRKFPDSPNCRCTCHGKITDFDRETIQLSFRGSASIEQLATYYQTTPDEIADILGLPKSKKQRMRIHLEHNYFDHGSGPKIQEQRRLEFYSEFLQDGDFEKYLPCAFMSWHNPIKIIRYLQARKIKKTRLPHSEVRRLWILGKFTKYQQKDWIQINNEIYEYLEQLGWKYSL